MKIGIILPSLELNQLAFEILTEVNDLILNTTEHDFVIFYQELTSRCVEPACSIMNISEIHSFSGLLISTTLDTAELALKSISISKKVFFVWDLEFIRNKNEYLKRLSIYRNPELFLVGRSVEYNRALEIFCNRKVNMTQQRLNIKELVKCLKLI